MKRKVLTVILAAAVCMTVLSPMAAMAKPAPKKQVTKKQTASVKKKTAPVEKEKKDIHVLFIGNSMVYYNNLPEMYSRMVTAGTKAKVTFKTLAYAGRNLKTHAKAIKAVIHSKGKASKLSKSEKATINGSVQSFNQGTYDIYKDALITKSGKVKKYDYIFLQDHGYNHSYEDSKEGVFSIVKSVATKNTRVVIFMPNYRVEESLEVEKKEQDQHDEIVDRIQEKLLKSNLTYKSAYVAHPGKAFFNYFYYYGSKMAMNRSPKDFSEKIYRAGTDAKNDLLVSAERLHHTQLGSYLCASTLYSTVYGESALDTLDRYRAESDINGIKMNSLVPCNNFSIRNGTYRDKKMLRAACFIADQTVNHEMDLHSKTAAKKWKKNPKKSNFIVKA